MAKNFNHNWDFQSFVFDHSYTEKPSDITTHIHNGYELYYFLSGDLTYYVEGQVYQLEPGDIIITNRRELHRIVFHSQKPYERIFIHFKPEFITPLIQNEDFNPLYYLERRKPGFFNKLTSDKVKEYAIPDLWQRIEESLSENTLENHFMVKLLLLQMLTCINRSYSENKKIVTSSSVNNDKVIEILDFINNHMEQKITLVSLENMFFVNKYYLCHIFKLNTGFTVNEYITYKRIIKAQELLNRKMPVLEVSDAVGFGDYSNFYKAFKRISGCSPKKYSKQNP